MAPDNSSVDHCPHCHRPMLETGPVARYGLQLRGPMLIYGEKRVRLSRQVAAFARVMIEWGQATHRLLIDKVSPSRGIDNVHHKAFYFRRALKLLGAPIVLESLPSWGYELTARP